MHSIDIGPAWLLWRWFPSTSINPGDDFASPHGATRGSAAQISEMTSLVLFDQVHFLRSVFLLPLYCLMVSTANQLPFLSRIMGAIDIHWYCLASLTVICDFLSPPLTLGMTLQAHMEPPVEALPKFQGYRWKPSPTFWLTFLFLKWIFFLCMFCLFLTVRLFTLNRPVAYWVDLVAQSWLLKMRNQPLLKNK